MNGILLIYGRHGSGHFGCHPLGHDEGQQLVAEAVVEVEVAEDDGCLLSLPYGDGLHLTEVGGGPQE